MGPQSVEDYRAHVNAPYAPGVTNARQPATDSPDFSYPPHPNLNPLRAHVPPQNGPQNGPDARYLEPQVRNNSELPFSNSWINGAPNAVPFNQPEMYVNTYNAPNYQQTYPGPTPYVEHQTPGGYIETDWYNESSYAPPGEEVYPTDPYHRSEYDGYYSDGADSRYRESRYAEPRYEESRYDKNRQDRYNRLRKHYIPERRPNRTATDHLYQRQYPNRSHFSGQNRRDGVPQGYQNQQDSAPQMYRSATIDGRMPSVNTLNGRLSESLNTIPSAACCPMCGGSGQHRHGAYVYPPPLANPPVVVSQNTPVLLEQSPNGPQTTPVMLGQNGSQNPQSYVYVSNSGQVLVPTTQTPVPNITPLQNVSTVQSLTPLQSVPVNTPSNASIQVLHQPTNANG